MEEGAEIKNLIGSDMDNMFQNVSSTTASFKLLIK